MGAPTPRALLFVVMTACASAVAAQDSMQGTAPATWLPGHHETGTCGMDRQGRLSRDADSAIDVTVGKTREGPFTVSDVGPSGSGRFWEVGVSFEVASELYGFCFQTATTGWKQIGENRKLAERMSSLIRFVQDVDGDGDDELVIPESVHTHDLSPCSAGAGCALSVTAYDRQGDEFVKDERSTQALLSRMSDAYRQAAAAKHARHADREHYAEAATALTRLARD